MKKLLLISLLIGAMPLAMMAQDDDLYFVSKKNKQTSKVEKVTETYAQPSEVQYEGSNRTVDEYNRRTAKSTYEVIDGDTTKIDVIDFAEGKGVYPDSLQNEDFKLTKKMLRFEDYDISNNAAFWAGYHIGLSYWHSPWYYSRYGWGWYDPWYDPWYYGGWYSSYYPWYDPWYYPYGYYAYYGWGYPYYYGYYGWGWPYYYGWGYPHYYGGGGNSHYYGHTGNAGTIDRRGSSHHPYTGGRGPIAGNSQRSGSLRDRAARMGGGQVYSSGNSTRSRSGNFGGYRGSSSNSSRGTYNSGSSSSRSSGSFGSSSGRSSGGGFSGGSRSSGGGHSGGGGGGRMGGRR
jgi:hypothetical protein